MSSPLHTGLPNAIAAAAATVAAAQARKPNALDFILHDARTRLLLHVSLG